jgi:excisionase family DNA binding protein
MTTAVFVNDTVLIDVALQATAIDLVQDVGDDEVEGLILRAGGQEHAVAPALAELVVRILEHTAEGGAFTVRSIPEEVTTTVAARMLGLSRPTLMKLIDDGTIVGRKVGSHTRLASSDVIGLREKRSAQRRTAFDELRRLSDELGEA